MSSFVCANELCTFTRVDTNGYGINPYLPFYPSPIDIANETSTNATSIPFDDQFQGDDAYVPYDDGSLYGNDTIAPWTDKANQDLISPSVAITRDFLGGIFNARVEGDQYNEGYAPAGTEWSRLPEGKTFEEARCSLRFCGWLECFALYDIKSALNKPGVVHLIEEDLYYNIMFTNWSSARDDSYYYLNRNLQEEPKPRRAQDERPEKKESRPREGRRAKEGSRRTQDGRAPQAPLPESVIGDVDTAQSYDCIYLGNCNDGASYYYPPSYGTVGIGGGFQYIRDEFPIAYDDSLECPKCTLGRASPEELKGPVDDMWQEVSVTGVTPADVDIIITAVGQDNSPRCNKKESNGAVRPNAMGVGNSTVELRRTIVAGQLSPFRYTVYFNATTKAGSCIGQVYVCSAPEGLDCNSYYGYDATATEFCEYY